MGEPLLAPFVYFGGKRTIAPTIWQALGDVAHYVEAFCGSLATLLARPGFDPSRHLETVNDKDSLVQNFWRAVTAEPEAVAHYAAWPVMECDLHARHSYLVAHKDGLQARLEGDPLYYDALLAGWWVWGMACWIGSAFCSGQGPWQVQEGRLVKGEGPGQGVSRQLPYLWRARGVQRRLQDGTQEEGLCAWFQAIQHRLWRVRIACGDWQRILEPSVLHASGAPVGILLDPPYSAEAGRDNGLYRQEDGAVAHAVRAWCLAHGADPRLRIVLCGYTGEHEALAANGWQQVSWSTHGGYANQGPHGEVNRHREVLWLSPQCLDASPQQPMLF